jgi:proteasome accessory factor B
MRNESLYRQWQMLHTIYNHRIRGISKRELADIYEVSKKTIERDITNLSSVGFPIYDEIDPCRDNQVIYRIYKGYTIPELNLSELENYTMFIIMKMVSPWQGYLDGLAKYSFKKIFSQADQNFVDFMRKVSEQIVPTSTNTMNLSGDSSEVLINIVKAIYNHKKIKIVYSSVFSHGIKEHIISPLSLKFHNNNIYLAGYLRAKNQTLIFALNRINELTLLTETQDSVKFDPQDFFDKSFGISQGQPFSVKLRFTKNVAQYVSERIWHPKQEITNCENGDIILSFEAKSLDETVSFVLSFKENVEVVEPEMLKEKVVETLQLCLQKYADSNTKEEISNV